MDIQPIYNVAEICYQHGIRNVIISPGSRSAPLTLAFARHPEITSRIVPDERSAAFIALGMALGTGTPVILICTSGSAVYNYAPAVAEAWFNHVPLIVFSADRPPEWWGQRDGQTIWQENIFGKHVAWSRSAPADLSSADAETHVYRLVNDAINVATTGNQPVHLNFPFREPFYPGPDEPTYFDSGIRILNKKPGVPHLDENTLAQMASDWQNHRKKLILIGQDDPDDAWLSKLDEVAAALNIPVIGDIISNAHPCSTYIHGADMHLRDDRADADSFRPDLLISFGRSVLSKSIKQFFRKNKPAVHWHVDTDPEITDTFQTMTSALKTDRISFLDWIQARPDDDTFTVQKQSNYLQLWKFEQDRTATLLTRLFEDKLELGQFEMVYRALAELPDGCNLHLANSMAVRYANYVGLPEGGRNIRVFGNRGVCGIDGCNSTAVGVALSDPDKLNVLITGDMAFLYDRNAFWHNYSLNNLRIIVLNDHGGGIFRMINGPAQLPELQTFFETRQPLNAVKLCEEFEFDYVRCDKRSKIANLLHDFYLPDSRTRVMEVETSGEDNQAIMARFRQSLK